MDFFHSNFKPIKYFFEVRRVFFCRFLFRFSTTFFNCSSTIIVEIIFIRTTSSSISCTTSISLATPSARSYITIFKEFFSLFMIKNYVIFFDLYKFSTVVTYGKPTITSNTLYFVLLAT